MIYGKHLLKIIALYKLSSLRGAKHWLVFGRDVAICSINNYVRDFLILAFVLFSASLRRNPFIGIATIQLQHPP
jgi:hypothetical protein